MRSKIPWIIKYNPTAQRRSFGTKRIKAPKTIAKTAEIVMLVTIFNCFFVFSLLKLKLKRLK